MKIRVYYEDTDMGGIVYHTNYIKYCERARSEIFFQNDMIPGTGAESGFVVRRLQADFYGSAQLGDLLTVKTTLLGLKRTSCTLLQEIYKEKEKLFKMEVLLVYMENGKMARIPKQFQTLFDTIEKNPGGSS